MLKGEGEPGANARSLAIDSQPATITVMHPLQFALVVAWSIVLHHQHIVDHRPLSHFGAVLEKSVIAALILAFRVNLLPALRLCYLNEALIPFTQHFCKRQDILVAHTVCGHRS